MNSIVTRKISLVAAMSRHRVIGFGGKMPWHLPAELAYFKKITLAKPVLMGRRTFESIGRALPQRRNLVLSGQRDLQLPGCEMYSALEAALAAVSNDEELMVIGGAELFRQTLPLAQRLYLTFIDYEFPGDAYFPEWDQTQWREIASAHHPTDAKNPLTFRTVLLEKK
jgi:dihydrofolate reductase